MLTSELQEMQSLQVCCKSQSHCKCTQIYMEMRKKAVTLLQRHQNNIHSNYCPNCINSCKNPRIEDMPLGPRLRACCPHFTAFSSLRFSPGTRLASHCYTALTSRSSNRVGSQFPRCVTHDDLRNSTQAASVCGKHPCLQCCERLAFGLPSRFLSGSSSRDWRAQMDGAVIDFVTPSGVVTERCSCVQYYVQTL